MYKLFKSNLILILLATTFFACNFETKAVIVDLDKAESEVKEFIGSSFNFFQTGKIEDAKSTFSDDAILIGTDAAEFYNGWDEIEPSIIAQLAIIKNAKFDTRNLQITLSSDGEMASYTSVVDFSFTVGGDDGAINNLRNSGVVKKINGDWRMTQVHWSVGLVGQAVEY
tara:strand:+ start:69 stop:575 length:507 start_codon:yes stop_codon:yes gene_type:complete